MSKWFVLIKGLVLLNTRHDALFGIHVNREVGISEQNDFNCADRNFAHVNYQRSSCFVCSTGSALYWTIFLLVSKRGWRDGGWGMGAGSVVPVGSCCSQSSLAARLKPWVTTLMKVLPLIYSWTRNICCGCSDTVQLKCKGHIWSNGSTRAGKNRPQGHCR